MQQAPSSYIMMDFHLPQQLMVKGEVMEEVGGEGDKGNPWWMCEKERDQLIGKTDCEGERERKKGSVRGLSRNMRVSVVVFVVARRGR